METVTIDHLKTKHHVRWAQDQEVLDSTFVRDSHLVASHSEITGLSWIYPSKFDELFELQKRNLPWASFSPPHNFFLFSKRFFSYRLFPNIDCEEEKNEEDEEVNTLTQQIIGLKGTKRSQSLFRKR